MNEFSQDLLKQQYDSLPYPKVPLEKTPEKDYNSLFTHNLVTPYYLYTQSFIETKDKFILDVGCGSGWTTLELAFANPGARIVAIDLSKNSLEVAQERLTRHGFDNVEYHHITMENIAQLGYEFDYINCEDVLYFSPNPAQSLTALKSVLKSRGIIRGNFHSYYQRFYHYLSQELFRCLGLFDENPDEFEIEVVADTMKNLKANTLLRARAGSFSHINNFDLTSEKSKQRILMNNLIQDDRGYTIPEIFELLEQTQLQFISMVNWRQWDVRDLFNDRDNLPTVWEFALENASEMEQLRLFELIHPCHRLIDLWFVHDSFNSSFKSVSAWDDNDWQGAIIRLHPQLMSAKVREDLVDIVKGQKIWQISNYISLPTVTPINISSHLGALLLPLWEGAFSFEEMVCRWLQLQPKNLISGEDKSEVEARDEVKDLLIKLETFLYVLVERRV